MALRFTTAAALALLLAACGDTGAEDASPYAAGDEDAAEVNAGETSETSETAEPETVSDTEEDADPRAELDGLTRTACDEGFADALPEGSAFASRGPDGRVHAAWFLDGEREAHILRPADMEMEARTAFDLAAAEFLRHNLSPDVDRAGLTGAYRGQDGRFCIIQTEPDVVDALREAVNTALAQAPAETEREASEG